MRPLLHVLMLFIIQAAIVHSSAIAQEAIPPKRDKSADKDEQYYRILQEMEEQAEENRKAYKRIVQPLSNTITPLVLYSSILIAVALLAGVVILWVYLDAKRAVNDPSKLIAKDEWLQKKLREHQARQRPPTERIR